MFHKILILSILFVLIECKKESCKRFDESLVDGECVKHCSLIKCSEDAECKPFIYGGICRCHDSKKSYHDGECIDNCSFIKCGENTKCLTGECKCEEGFVGDPKIHCFEDPCLSNPCGSNECSFEDNLIVCTCRDGVEGYPGMNCDLNCTSNEMCASDEYCFWMNNKCEKGCRENGCQEMEHCNLDSRKCQLTCSKANDCADDEFCNYGECFKPCKHDHCGPRSICHTFNHSSTTYCSCEDGFIPEPTYGCRKIKSLECGDENCNLDLQCDKFCSADANCTFINGKIACYCEEEPTDKDPFLSCTHVTLVDNRKKISHYAIHALCG